MAFRSRRSQPLASLTGSPIPIAAWSSQAPYASECSPEARPTRILQPGRVMKLCLSCRHSYEGQAWRCDACGQGPVHVDGYLAFSPRLAEVNDGFRPEDFAHLARLESSNFWFRCRNRLISWALHRYFPEAGSFLEIGCGTGFVLSGIQQAAPHLRLSGSEVHVRGLPFAQSRLRPDVSLFQMDARAIPFQAEYDILGAFDVLEHIEEDEAVLSEMFQATRPGGGILVTVPQHRFLWSYVDDYSFHKRRYSRRDLVRKVRRAGFEVVRVTSFVFSLLPLLLLSRIRVRRKPKDFDPTRELATGVRLNAVLERLLDCERFWIERGVSFPAGGSLLLIGRKIR
jgi:SAM-dependent methyltransferase